MKLSELIQRLQDAMAHHGDVKVILRRPADYEDIQPVSDISVRDYGTGKCGGELDKPSKYTKKAVFIQ